MSANKCDKIDSATLQMLCREFFMAIGADVRENGAFLKVVLPENCPFEWDKREFFVGFEEGMCDEVGKYLFYPGSALFHKVHKWLKEKAAFISIKLPELRNQKELKLNFHACKPISVRQRKTEIRGIIATVLFSPIPSSDGSKNLRSFLALENGSIEDVTHEMHAFLLSGKVVESLAINRLTKKLGRMFQKKCQSLLSEWLLELTEMAAKRAKIELQRISSYYENLLMEAAFNTKSDEQFWHKMRQLANECGEKMAEEAERFQPIILANVIGIVGISIPSVEFEVTIASESSEAKLLAYYDLFRGVFLLPQCMVCSSKMDSISLCSNGHIVCPDCALKCTSCGKIWCKDCIVGLCKVCDMPTCKECYKSCYLCHRYVCTAHAVKCNVCSQIVCKNCANICEICGKMVCTNDSISCHICGKAFCKKCIQSEDVKIHVCPTCGRSVCLEHMDVCSICDEIICTECMTECSICKAKTCAKHSFKASCCSSTLCNKHKMICQLCGNTICPEHAAKCGICGSIICHSCSKVCTLCEQHYCTACMKGRSICALCIKLLNSSEKKLHSSQLPYPLPKSSFKRKSCRVVVTKHLSLFLWQDNLDGVLVVAKPDGKVIFSKRLNALWLLRHLKG